MISAVHCTIFPKDQKLCSSSPTTMFFRGIKAVLSCETLSNGDTKIVAYNPPSMIWLGVNRFSEEFHAKEAQGIRISYIIQPKGAYYRPGTYGDYGGYDIVLGKLDKEAPVTFQPACIPQPSFKDIAKSKLAGYGQHVRHKCITNSYGPSKSHYCSTRNELHKKMYKKHKFVGKTLFKGKTFLRKNILKFLTTQTACT